MPPSQLPHRHSHRIPGFDYSQPGLYFVTMVTHDRANLFGTVLDGRMLRSLAGDIADQEWARLPSRFCTVELDRWIVMPNHLHAILRMVEPPGGIRNTASLGRVIGAFKSASARWINRVGGTPGARVWQRDDYERVIHDEKAWAAVRAYIEANPGNWRNDRHFCP